MRGKSKKRKARTAAQQCWLEAVASMYPNCVIHHPVGETGRHNKLQIGQWWIVPMSNEEHIALHQENATFGHETRKGFEKSAFLGVVQAANAKGFDLPPPEIIEAIMDYHL